MSTPEDSEFVALLTSHQSDIRFYVNSLLPGESQSADVAQQANATLWTKREEFESGTNFKAWAFAVARYEVLNFRKKQAKDYRLVFSEEMEERFAEELPQRSPDLDTRHEALRQCLRGLKPKDRELIDHRYASKEGLAEYAATTNRSVGSLKVTLHRIRNRLLQCIESKMSLSNLIES